MNHANHVYLLRKGVPAGGEVWADLGSGAGAFTLALADLLAPGAEIYSVDRDASALRQQADALRRQFPQTLVHQIHADFTQPLDLPLLDGIVMANALHFVARARQVEVVKRLRSYLRPGGRLIIVEYDADDGNIWVPNPLSHQSWEKVAKSAGFATTQQLASVPSRFLGAIYSSASW